MKSAGQIIKEAFDLHAETTDAERQNELETEGEPTPIARRITSNQAILRWQGADVDRHHQYRDSDQWASAKARCQHQQRRLQCEAGDVDRLHRKSVGKMARQHLQAPGDQVDQRHQHRNAEHALPEEIGDPFGASFGNAGWVA